MSMRGTMISRTGCSPSSMTLAIISRSSSSRSVLPSTRWRSRSSASAGVSPAARPAAAAAQRVERVQRQQHDEEQHPIQQLDRPHERQRHLLGSGQRQHAPQELHQQQHQQLQTAPSDDGDPRRGADPEVEVEPEADGRRRAQRQRVDEQDRRQGAGRLVEQPHERAGRAACPPRACAAGARDRCTPAPPARPRPGTATSAATTKIGDAQIAHVAVVRVSRRVACVGDGVAARAPQPRLRPTGCRASRPPRRRSWPRRRRRPAPPASCRC